jgi:hypothetical protein
MVDGNGEYQRHPTQYKTRYSFRHPLLDLLEGFEKISVEYDLTLPLAQHPSEFLIIIAFKLLRYRTIPAFQLQLDPVAALEVLHRVDRQ